MAKILNVESLTITVPLGGTITRNSFPKVLWVNYDEAPFFGYINFPQPLEDHLFLVNTANIFYKYISSVKQRTIAPAATLQQAIEQIYGTIDPTAVSEIFDYVRKANLALNLSLGTSGSGVTAMINFPNCGELNIPGIGTGLVPLQFASGAPDAICTNLPTNKQQEILIKGAIQNIVTSSDGYTSYDSPVIFYISILVGGIDYNPASRFPNDIDPLDHDIKEPVTSADIPAVDAFQYLISLQTRTQAENAQLESLKRSLTKKMIMARDINWLRNCLLQVELTYADMKRKMEQLRNDVDQIIAWIVGNGPLIYQLQQTTGDLKTNLEENWKRTAEGYEFVRKDVHERVYHALKHYGAASSSQQWFRIPMYGREGGPGSFNKNFKFKSSKTGLTYSISFGGQVINGQTDKYEMDFTQGFEIYGYNVTQPQWDDNGNWAQLSKSGENSFNTKEYFHNLVIRSSHTSNHFVGITNNKIIMSTSEDLKSSKSVEIENISSSSAAIRLADGRSAFISNDRNEQYVMLGDEGHNKVLVKHYDVGGNKYVGYIGMFQTTSSATDKAGDGNRTLGSFVAFDYLYGAPTGAAGGQIPNRINIGGKQVVFRDEAGNHFMNFYVGPSSKTETHTITISIGGGGPNGEDNFYIGKRAGNVSMQYEGNPGEFCGLRFSTGGEDPELKGLTLFGLSQRTINDLMKKLVDDGTSGEGEEAPPPLA